MAILQNYNWQTTLYNIPPQFTLGTDLIYRYDEETAFDGGNEYLNFDTKDLRAPSIAISKIEVDELYHHILFPNAYRYDREYTFFPDINGDFRINTTQGPDFPREAEFAIVHFALPYNEVVGLDEVYVVGKFNNYELNEETK